jgi:hypothetical protein
MQFPPGKTRMTVARKLGLWDEIDYQEFRRRGQKQQNSAARAGMPATPISTGRAISKRSGKGSRPAVLAHRFGKRTCGSLGSSAREAN